MRILLNAANAVSAGGSVVVAGILESLPRIAPDDFFVAYVPSGVDFESTPHRENLQLEFVRPSIPGRAFERCMQIYWRVAKWCRVHHIDVCFTLGDIGPAQLPIPHVVLLQQAWIVYRNSDVERRWSMLERLKFQYSRWHFGRMAPRCDRILVQTPVVEKHLLETYPACSGKTETVMPALPGHLSSVSPSDTSPHSTMRRTDCHVRLLYLAAGYEHKNHTILPALIEALVQRGLANTVHFFVTLGSATRSYERDVLESLAAYPGQITNLGQLHGTEVASALSAADALFLPTFLETVGLVYLEAMAYGCPILTSDMDFARWMCGDTALYFDPSSADSIADIVSEFALTGMGENYSEIANRGLARFPQSWTQVSSEYASVLHALGGETAAERSQPDNNKMTQA